MGHVLGPKNDIVLIRGRGRPAVYGGRACGILSIPAQEVSLGSLWVVLDMVSRLPRMRPGSGHNRPILSPLRLNSLWLAWQLLPELSDRRIDGVCGTGGSSPPDLPPETSRSRATPEKSE